MSRGILLGLLIVAAAAAPALGQSDQTVGQRFRITPADLPAPYQTPVAANPSEVVERPRGATLDVPPGFEVNLFADGLERPRWMAVADNGDVVLTEPRAGRIRVLRDGDGDGRAEVMETFSDEIDAPHGLAIHGGWLYVSNPIRVWRYRYRPGQTRAAGPAEAVTPPGALGDGGGHYTRNLAVAPDGSALYVAIGSRSNTAEEPAPRATVQRFNLDGSGGGTTFAAGLRNPVGIAFRPGTDELYVVVNERDGLGDGLVPDYLTRVREGQFFGWPYAYIGPNPDPDYGDRRPELVARTQVPDLLFQSHSAPLGLVFYDRAQFPEEYRGDAFVALHGSWNAEAPTGYKVVRVPFEEGRPAGWYENFATGFWISGEERAAVWGRPAGLALAWDGSLLIADDAGGAVWRISYRGE